MKSILLLSFILLLVKTQIPEDFVYLREIEPSIIQEMRYAGYHNFVGRPIDGYNAGECILTKQAAYQLKQIQQVLLAQKQSLKVYDCYRPQKAVDYFYKWSQDPTDVTMKEEFYPTLKKTELFPLGYIAYKSGHTRGSTMDLTIIDLPAKQEPEFIPGEKLQSCINPPDQRWPDNSLNFGTGFDCFNELAHTANPDLPEKVKERRQNFVSIMKTFGFKNYSAEWWHYTLIYEPYPDTYFDFNVDPIPSTSKKFLN